MFNTPHSSYLKFNIGGAVRVAIQKYVPRIHRPNIKLRGDRGTNLSRDSRIVSEVLWFFLPSTVKWYPFGLIVSLEIQLESCPSHRVRCTWAFLPSTLNFVHVVSDLADRRTINKPYFSSSKNMCVFVTSCDASYVCMLVDMECSLTEPNSLCLSLIHIWRCRRSTLCRSRWSPYH